MAEISTLQEGITNVKDLIGDAVSNLTNSFVSNPKAVAIGSAIAGAGLGAGATLLATSISKRRKKRKARSKVSRKRNSKRSRRRNLKYARTAGKRKDTSHRRIRMTKNGQPYIIQADGRARFISKSSARRSRKMKGGRY